MIALEVLRTARAIVADPERWTREAYARDDTDNIVGVLGDRAVKFCALGSVKRAAFNIGADLDVAVDLLYEACDQLGYGNDIVEANDNLSHLSVVAMFDKAIALAQEID
jgi:predicted nucleotidyltransferase